MDKKRHTLTDAEEMLLGKFLDNEATFFERIAARKLISNLPAAENYLASIRRIQTPLKDALPIAPSSLWMRISARLHAEERSELLLGKRALQREGRSFGFTPSRVFLSGGAAAAMTAVALFIVMPRSPLTTDQTALGNSSAQIAPVSLQRGMPLAVPASVGVDWMRSDGRLQVMHEPAERAPLIFVKRRYNRVGPIYKTERNSQGVIMQENRSMPQGIAVNSSR